MPRKEGEKKEKNPPEYRLQNGKKRRATLALLFISPPPSPRRREWRRLTRMCGVTMRFPRVFSMFAYTRLSLERESSAIQQRVVPG